MLANPNFYSENDDMNLIDFAKAVGMDLNDVIDRFSGNTALLVRMLKKFPGDKAFSDIESAMAKGDYASASEAAHSLKGLSGNLGLNNLYKIAGGMNQAGKEADYSEFEIFFAELKREYGKVLTAVGELEPID